MTPRPRVIHAPEDHFGVVAAERYWHFVDVVWVFIYPTFYLL